MFNIILFSCFFTATKQEHKKKNANKTIFLLIESTPSFSI